MKKLILIICAIICTSLVVAQDKRIEVGDTILVKKTATHFLSGKKISVWVYYTTHIVSQVGSKKYPNGVCLKGINSWLNESDITLCGKKEEPVVVESDTIQVK